MHFSEMHGSARVAQLVAQQRALQRRQTSEPKNQHDPGSTPGTSVRKNAGVAQRKSA